MIVARIGSWEVHGSAMLSKEEVASLASLQRLHEELEEGFRQTRSRLAHALLRSRHLARRKGYEQGRKQAFKDVFGVFEKSMKVWGGAERHLRTAAEKVIREALGGLPPDALLMARINQGLLAARRNPVVRIYVYPEQFSLVDRLVMAFEAKHGKSGCEAVADARLRDGEVRIETETGVLEVDFDRQVSAICTRLLRDLSAMRDEEETVSS